MPKFSAIVYIQLTSYLSTQLSPFQQFIKPKAIIGIKLFVAENRTCPCRSSSLIYTWKLQMHETPHSSRFFIYPAAEQLYYHKQYIRKRRYYLYHKKRSNNLHIVDVLKLYVYLIDTLACVGKLQILNHAKQHLFIASIHKHFHKHNMALCVFYRQTFKYNIITIAIQKKSSHVNVKYFVCQVKPHLMFVGGNTYYLLELHNFFFLGDIPKPALIKH